MSATSTLPLLHQPKLAKFLALCLTLLVASFGSPSAHAAAATQFSVTAPTNVINGTAFSITVTAQDNTPATDTGYVGTVHFTSSDPQATLPADYTFVVGDAGVHTFTGVVLRTLGNQTITVTDTVDNTITGMATVAVDETPSTIVTTTSDASTPTDGLTSLREAINAANATPGSTISFNIPAAQAAGGVFTIQPASNLPTITAAGTIIDGSTQTAFTGDTNPNGPEVVLNGTNATLISINASNCLVRNLVLTKMGSTRYGIIISGGTGSVVQGCYIGTDATGTIGTASSDYGIIISSNNNLIGGTTPAARNVISGNYFATQISGSNNTIEGNYIGTDATGSFAVPNTLVSVYINGGSNNLIGGTAAGAGNVISGNQGAGFLIFGSGNFVQGNLIGTDVTGTKAIPNNVSYGGIYDSGITVTGSNNIIGLDSTGAGAGNVIANTSNGPGVTVQGSASVGNTIRGNEIFANNGIGVDLSNSVPDGVTANDVGDGDSGANGLQNYPVLTAATAITVGTSTSVSGTLNGTPNINFDIDFYANPTADPSGYGEGEYYLGSTNVTTDGSGNASFTATVGGVTSDARFISATATRLSPTDGTGNLGDTSEFSADLALNIAVAAPDTATTAEDTPVDINVLANDYGGPGSTLTVTGVTPNANTNGTVTINANGTLHYVPAANFNGTATFTYTISNGIGSSSSALVTVTVTPVNDAPVITAPSAQSVNEDTPLVFSSATNNAISIADVDANGAAEAVSLNVTNGTLTLSGTNGLTFSLGNGSANAGMTFQGTLAAINAALAGLTFNPAPNYNGAAVLTVNVNDLGNTGAGGAQTANQTLTITVLPVNDPPVAANDAYLVSGSSLTVAAPGVLSNDTDIDSPTITAVLVSGPTHGTLTLNPDGSFIYAPGANFGGGDSFTYKASDGQAFSNVATVTLSAAPALVLNLSATTFSESAGAGAITGTVTRTGGAASALTVTLTSSNPGQATVPSTVTIAAGAASATFPVTAVDNGIVTPTQFVTISATAASYPPASITASVTDNDAPLALAFFTPHPGAAISDFSNISGSVSGVPGLNFAVKLSLKRLQDNKYWDGTAFVSDPTVTVTGVANDSSFLVPTNRLPHGRFLNEGAYSLTVTVTDSQSHSGTVTERITVDKTPPVVTLNALTTLSAITGTATDTGGSGVQRVFLLVRRISDGKYFNGTAFVTAPTVQGVVQTPMLTTSYDPKSGHWARRSGLPTVTSDSYRVTAVALDGAANRGEATQTFTAKTAIPSTTLSTASASVASNSVTLRFGGALEAESASDAAHYSVTVNGKAVTVESAGYNANNHGVALGLAEGTLKAGDQVVVKYSGLSDSAGHVVDGQSGAVTAR